MLKCKSCDDIFDEEKATNVCGIIYCPNCGDTEQEPVTFKGWKDYIKNNPGIVYRKITEQ